MGRPRRNIAMKIERVGGSKVKVLLECGHTKVMCWSQHFITPPAYALCDECVGPMPTDKRWPVSATD